MDRRIIDSPVLLGIYSCFVNSVHPGLYGVDLQRRFHPAERVLIVSQSNQLCGLSILFHDFSEIAKAYGVTILTTLVGTVVSLLITALLLIRYPDPSCRFVVPFPFIFFTMLFGGGMVPWYITYVNMFDLKNTIFAMIIPNLLLSAFNVLLMRSFFASTIPESVVESATIDGASELKIFFKIVVPLLPIMATIGLFNTLSYWNDWYNCMLFIDKPELYNIQYLMTKTLTNIQYLLMKSNSSAQVGDPLAKMPRETVRMALAIVGIAP